MANKRNGSLLLQINTTILIITWGYSRDWLDRKQIFWRQDAISGYTSHKKVMLLLVPFHLVFSRKKVEQKPTEISEESKKYVYPISVSNLVFSVTVHTQWCKFHFYTETSSYEVLPYETFKFCDWRIRGLN